MKEVATIVKITGKIAVVQIEKHTECDSCKACAFRNGKSTVKLKALNEAGAVEGDRVIVQAEKDNRLLASFVVYIIPVLTAAAGVLIGAFCLKQEIWMAVLCLVGLAVGFAAVFCFDKIFAKTRGFGMEVIQILQKADTENKIYSKEDNNGKGI